MSIYPFILMSSHGYMKITIEISTCQRKFKTLLLDQTFELKKILNFDGINSNFFFERTKIQTFFTLLYYQS